MRNGSQLSSICEPAALGHDGRKRTTARGSADSAQPCGYRLLQSKTPSGDDSTGPLPRQRFSVSFYLTAMLFIVFDIEIVFLYPLAVQLHALGWFGFAELAFFIVILLVAYVYIWRKGALNW